MFTGIVKEIGKVKAITHKNNLSVIDVQVQDVVGDVKLGDSIALNGVCLTVTKIKGKVLSFDMMKETLLTTTLGKVSVSDPLNIEPALRADDRLGGHFVTGHVDGIGVIKEIKEIENYTEIIFTPPKGLLKYIVPKGSVCINGVSLTVGEVKASQCSVYLIPFTKEVTTFGILKAGDCVNIEVDILARYVLNQRKG